MARAVRTLAWVRLCLLLLASAHCAAQGQAQWQDFKWVGHGAEPHAAILLPVKLEGADCWMQFDTGAAASVLYRPILPAAIASDGPVARANLGVGGVSSSRQFQLMYPDDAKARTAGCRKTFYDGLAGTLGDDIFLGAAIELDLKSGRFRLFGPKDELPAALSKSRRISFTLGQAFDGKVPLVSARLPDGRPAQLLFDTGSAGMDLGVFRESDWLALVGPAQAAHAASVDVPAWGRSMACRTAPTQEAIEFDGLKLPAGLEARYCAVDGKPAFDGRTEFGVLGLKPFRGKSMVIDFAGQTVYVYVPGGSNTAR